MKIDRDLYLIGDALAMIVDAVMPLPHGALTPFRIPGRWFLPGQLEGGFSPYWCDGRNLFPDREYDGGPFCPFPLHVPDVEYVVPASQEEWVRKLVEQKAYIQLCRLIDQGKVKPCDSLGMFMLNLVEVVSLPESKRMFIRADALRLLCAEIPVPIDEPGEAGEVMAGVDNPIAPPDPGAPAPLTTGDIAHCFAGLRRWNELRWRKALGDPPKWLQRCVAVRGQRGVRETQWNPVEIGGALIRRSGTPPRSVRARFQSNLNPMLRPWLETWKTFEADYCEGD